MDILKLLRAFLVLFLFVSCAKLSYLTEQGLGQAKILSDARDNSKVLEDPNVKEEHKEKIRKIETYKKFFYEFWQREPSEIYSETNLLNRDAVTYLVIASKPREIKPKKECFPFYGCFPYLGFFKNKSADEHVKSLQREGFETYKRKVLAYSTLGNFDDPILSTFFQYDEYELAETIFHELFHTIFFIDDEVDLNENLANFFGKAMVYKFFKDKQKLDGHYANEQKFSELLQEIVQQSKKLEVILGKESWQTEKEKFLKEDFPREVKEKCLKLGLNSCWPLRLKWNTATFAAFNTYEKNQDKIKIYAKKFNGDLKAFFDHITKKYEEYKSSDARSNNINFEKYLLSM
jgi:predicted aminopeptidase